MPERQAYPPGIFEASPPNTADKLHIAQKPESVMRWIMQIVEEGQTVLDPFMGSGTTLRAAMDCGCPAIGIELDEENCEKAARRLEQMVLTPRPVKKEPAKALDMFADQVEGEEPAAVE